MDPTVCALRSTEAGNAPQWLAQFIPLHPKLQQALDARRGNFPARVRPPTHRALSVSHTPRASSFGWFVIVPTLRWLACRGGGAWQTDHEHHNRTCWLVILSS
jgi:hypothetical protein